MISNLLKEKNLSIYQCSKLTGIPYTTLSEVVRGKTNIGKCTVETVYKLAKLLNTTVDELIRDTVEARIDFEIYKSNVCHAVRDEGELDFIINALKKDDIRSYWEKSWYPEAFYLLATVDYLSRLNGLPLCSAYNDIRSQSLKKKLYPRDTILADTLDPTLNAKAECERNAIPEFLSFNIVESEISNVY